MIDFIHPPTSYIYSLTHTRIQSEIQGVYDVYSKLRDSVVAEVARFNPRHVFITGHSLGGALTHLTSYAVASRFPSTRVDAVPFASIFVGDEAFMRAIKVCPRAACFWLGRTRLRGLAYVS